MCELCGISAAQDVAVEDLLTEFFSHSGQHPHGWGVAAFSGAALSLEKEAVRASDSGLLRQWLQTHRTATTLLAHIRLATAGCMNYENCHPFCQKDASGRRWTLIHNGTIFQGEIVEPYRARQQGSTDSERVLLYLVEQLDRAQELAGHPLTGAERFGVLEPLVAQLARGNKLNLLLYDGELLYAHTNYAHSLYVREDEDAACFCTVPLQEGLWQPMPMQTLCAYDRGRRVLQGTAHPNEYVDNPKDKAFLEVSMENCRRCRELSSHKN
jgi:glutamine amidotransferase